LARRSSTFASSFENAASAAASRAAEASVADAGPFSGMAVLLSAFTNWKTLDMALATEVKSSKRVSPSKK
jgi:hypothetical protein